MITDGGALYTQIEEQLPNFVQTNHPKFAKFVEKYYEFLELNLLTFNDLDLNEDKPIQELADVTYTVTVAIGNNDFSDSDNYIIEYFIDYDSKVHCENIDLSHNNDLIEEIVRQVSKIFTEMDCPEDEPTTEELNK